MADIKLTDRKVLERLFNMESGYVLDFSDKTFQEFIYETIGINIYSDLYSYKGTSKANRLRAFWEKEGNLLNSQLISGLIEYKKSLRINQGIQQKIEATKLELEANAIVERLKSKQEIDELDFISNLAGDTFFEKLRDNILFSIKNGQPEAALDRLHTIVVKHVRGFINIDNEIIDKNKPLHSIFGEYIKILKEKNLIDSDMSLRILKSTISIFESFNEVRNNQSFSHDNRLLSYHESIFILNNVLNILRFMHNIENEKKE
ncbi:abortive infection family protein [Leptospira meyeri]|uniref:abortive infection family protein n=1 Tax=Leptospira meyeri TaxID=29508 RepID=UPI00223D7D8F|nr:abortive infection family protein [Leptospira meyeri]MCW7490856.1 abortive infection family protein [Leptospira meyeri]